MMKVTEGCIGCGNCTTACQFEAIKLTDEGVAKIDPEVCVECGACAAICPMGVIEQE